MPLASPPSPNRMLPPNSFKNSVVMVVTTGHWLSQEIAASFASYGAAVVIAGSPITYWLDLDVWRLGVWELHVFIQMPRGLLANPTHFAQNPTPRPSHGGAVS